MSSSCYASPCLNCTYRQLNCHDTCTDYQVYRKNLDYRNEKRKRIQKEINDITGLAIDSRTKTKKFRNR